MELLELIRQAIIEDLGDGDHTSLSTLSDNATGKARLLVKEQAILAGVRVAEQVFREIDPGITMNIQFQDGTTVEKGDVAFIVEGRIQALLQAERLVLNFMQRMSGIATQTRRYVNEVAGLPVKILDTRKTTPNLRVLEKEAVRLGGGENHRMGLYDMILIKDNHVDYAGGISKAILLAREYLKRRGTTLPIEVETRNLVEVNEALLTGGIQRIMLDNFSLPDLQEAVKVIRKRVETEASGGITLENVRQYALCGVDYISVGALTHQIHSIDLSLKVVKEQ